MESLEVIMVGDELTATGFRMAGVRSYSINEKNKEQFYTELKDKKAILILSQKAGEILGEKTEKLKDKSLVITIPERQGEEYLAIKKIIKDTIGFDLRGY